MSCCEILPVPWWVRSSAAAGLKKSVVTQAFLVTSSRWIERWANGAVARWLVLATGHDAGVGSHGLLDYLVALFVTGWALLLLAIGCGLAYSVSGLRKIAGETGLRGVGGIDKEPGE